MLLGSGVGPSETDMAVLPRETGVSAAGVLLVGVPLSTLSTFSTAGAFFSRPSSTSCAIAFLTGASTAASALGFA